MQGGGDNSGRYRVLRRLAGGGMGEVYLAAATGPAGFSKLAVVKRILPHHAEDPEFVAMFLNEARLAAALDHPNIVRVYDFGEAEGSFFYAMEYLHGDSLANLLPRAAEQPERLPLAHALTIGLGICAGLHFAHECRGPDGKPLQIVHRDVSPGNVLVTCEGEAKILDFGIARAMSSTGVTRDGIRKGKVPYMSPEQCIGGTLNRRSDVFSIGILLYEMTTLSRLFRAANEFAVMNMITANQVPLPSSRVPDYPPALEAVVLKALQREREARYPTALALLEDLERVAAELGLRTSSLQLGRYVAGIVGDRPPLSADQQGPDEAQTSIFFAAVNEALVASQPIGRVAALPLSGVSDRDVAEPVHIAASTAPRRRRAVVAALGCATLAAGLAFALAGRSPEQASRAVEPVPLADLPDRASPAMPPVVAQPEPTPPPAVTPLPTPLADTKIGDPPARPRPETRARKKPAGAKKPNMLDSLRPSK